MNSLYFLAAIQQNSATLKTSAIVGLLFVGVCLLGGFLLACFLIYKAFSTRNIGWIIVAIVIGLPTLIFSGLAGIGLAIGLPGAWSKITLLTAQKHPLTIHMKLPPPQPVVVSPIAGQRIAYQISLPRKEQWKITPNPDSSTDYTFQHGPASIGIIPQNRGLKTPERAADLARQGLAKVGKNCKLGEVKPVQIDGRHWATFDATARINNTDLKYRYFVYSDEAYTFLIVNWSPLQSSNACMPIFELVAHSFKFPASDKAVLNAPSAKPSQPATLKSTLAAPRQKTPVISR